MSKYCACPQKINSQHLPDCKANYIGTSGGMEAEGAVKLFSRSVSKYNVRYTEYLGDGDCNGHAAVVSAQPYGPDVEIKKNVRMCRPRSEENGNPNQVLY